MVTPRLYTFTSFLVLILFISSGMHAMAAGESISVSLYSGAAVEPGTLVSFSTIVNGFISPQYSISDSFSAPGATTGTIDKVGYFTWTPKIYDAGRHSITVSVTDSYEHSASTAVNIFVTNNSIIVGAVSPGPIVAAYRPVTFAITAPGFITPSYYVYDSSYMSTLNSGNINSSGAFSWTPTLNEIGAHSIRILVTDPYGHTADSLVNITVIHPVVSVQSFRPGTTAEVGSSVSFSTFSTLSASTTYSVSDLFSGTTTVKTSTINSAGVFSWKPTISDVGLHSITTTAVDAYGNVASTTVAVVINTPTTNSTTIETPIAVPVATSTSTPVAPKKYIFTTNLSIGSRSTAVAELQKRLTTLGFYTGAINGYFNSLTSAGVKKFQRAHGLLRVGNVGPATRAALNK